VINEVCVVDIETGKTLPPNTVGVLKVRGHNVIAEYLNDPEATRKAIDADGWFDAGDGGYIDEEGFVYVSDRSE
jgi:long-subunit acyl-CoA synthetase (AMP-forming)